MELKKKSDSEIAASIKSKLGDAPSISYSEIAKKASEISRNELAVKVRMLWSYSWSPVDNGEELSLVCNSSG